MNAKLYVGNLSYGTTSDDLENAFKSFGSVNSATVLTDRDTGRSKGFGFVEIGTVTPRAQAGNPKKRLFRLIEDGGIINRMGFNNDGLQAAIEKFKGNKGKIIIGGNIGKNTDTKPLPVFKILLININSPIKIIPTVSYL